MDLAAWREALRVRVKLLYAAMRALYEAWRRPAVPGGRDPARRPARLRRRGRTAPLGGAVTGFIKTYKRERARAGESGRLRGRPQARRARGGADRGDARDPGAVEIGHAGETRWTVALAEPGRRRAARLDARPRQRVRRHRRGRQHRLGDRRRSRRGLGRHVPPARPRAGARAGRPRPRALRQRPRRARSATSSSASRRAANAPRRRRRARAGRARARARRAGRDPRRRRAGGAAYYHASTSPTPPPSARPIDDVRAQRPHRRAAARGGWRSAASCPTSRPPSSTSSST